MNNDSRIKNSARNAIVGLGGQGVIVLINFWSRGIFIKFLSVEYLGVNGLFSNVLTILSLAELGVGSAIIYSMYKPIAENDKRKTQALMNLYSRAYKIIGLVIAIVGILITPFIKYIIKDNGNIENIELIYLIFLLNTVVSYFFAYKRSIISADQRDYIVSGYKYTFNVIKIIIQILVLYIGKNFIAYLLVQVFCTVLENIFIAKRADKLYPFLKYKNKENLNVEEKRDIFRNIRALMIYKISSTMLDGTDNIIISAIIGVKSVGVLSNYTLIIGSISMVISQITGAITASIGNITSKETKEKQIEVFNIILFSTFILYGGSSVCLLSLINPFIFVFFGEQYILNKLTVIILVLNYYIYGMQNVVWTYRSTMGLFIYGKFRPVVSAIINIVVSIILAKYIGLLGVLMGTTITRIITNVWYDPIIIYKYGFKSSVKEYYVQYVKYVFQLLLTVITVGIIVAFIPDYSIVLFFIKSIISLILTIIIFFVIFRKKYEFKYLYNIINNILLKKKDIQFN